MSDIARPAAQQSHVPELPEVETIRRTLTPRLVGRTVRGVALHRRDVCAAHDSLGRESAARKQDLLLNLRIASLERRGKQLAILTDSGPCLCIHLGMTGQLVHRRRGERAERDHTHVIWTLDDGSVLTFRDPRRFGGVWAYRAPENLRQARWGALGPDALTISPNALIAPLSRSQRCIKSALLDQSVLAGVGNIYADEALFSAQLRPSRACGALRVAEIERLCVEVRAVLQRAIDSGGSTLRDYVSGDGEPGRAQFTHMVYGRADHPCRICATALRGVVLAQRTTVFCPSCQPAKSRNLHKLSTPLARFHPGANAVSPELRP